MVNGIPQDANAALLSGSAISNLRHHPRSRKRNDGADQVIMVVFLYLIFYPLLLLVRSEEHHSVNFSIRPR
jgi:hypothetical protein